MGKRTGGTGREMTEQPPRVADRRGGGCRERDSMAGFKSCTCKSEKTLSQTEFFKKNNLIFACVEFSSVQSLSRI